MGQLDGALGTFTSLADKLDKVKSITKWFDFTDKKVIIAVVVVLAVLVLLSIIKKAIRTAIIVVVAVLIFSSGALSFGSKWLYTQASSKVVEYIVDNDGKAVKIEKVDIVDKDNTVVTVGVYNSSSKKYDDYKIKVDFFDYAEKVGDSYKMKSEVQ